MSDYARAGSGGATHFGDKDDLNTGNADKVIVGSQFDDEYNAILTAVNSKYDSTNLASQVQAESGTNPTALMTPLRAEQHVVAYNSDNGGLLLDIQALADPGADTLLGWDESANDTILFTLGAGFLHTDTALSIDHDAATNFVADEHVLHAGVSVIAGAGMTGGGTISASRTLNVIGGDGITANANDVAITNQSASATVPVKFTSGALGWDSAAITEIDGAAISQSADGFLVDDAGVLKVVPYDQMGIITGTQDAAQTFALTDANTIQTLTGSTNRIWTIPPNSSVAFTKGTVIICQNSGTGDLKILGGTGVIIDSIFHAAAATAQSDVVADGGMAVLIKTATDTWALSGDIRDS